jgi:DNA-binding MarR family transcriptional regulator
MSASVGSSVRYQALIQLLRTADTLWNASRLFFARWNISPSQFNVLNLLSDQTDGLSQIELGRQLITHRSNVTGLVDRLEKRGLVARNNVVGDRRAYRVVLTSSGRKLLQQILPDFYSMAEAVWNGTPAARAKQVADDLAKIGANAQELPARTKEL